jgi:hypothetical protein
VGIGQRHSGADHDQFVAAVAAGDHYLRALDQPEDAADDHLDRVAVIHLSLGWGTCRALSYLQAFLACATPAPVPAPLEPRAQPKPETSIRF